MAPKRFKDVPGQEPWSVELLLSPDKRLQGFKERMEIGGGGQQGTCTCTQDANA